MVYIYLSIYLSIYHLSSIYLSIYLYMYIYIYMGALLTCKKCGLHRQVKPTAELDKCAQQLKDIKVSLLAAFGSRAL